MKPAVISVFLLSFLLPIAGALKCYKCNERTSETCDVEEVDCPEGDQCLTRSEQYIMNGTYRSIRKGCARGAGECDERLPFTKGENELFLIINTKCCGEYLCNNESYEIPEVDVEPNGVVCPNCFAFNTTEECESEEEIECQGDRDKCISYAGELEKPDGELIRYSVKGCTNTAGCKVDVSAMVGVREVKEHIFECTDKSGKDEK
ncbi:phospholipase A2 inhibitor gamma subunit B-like [Dendropsophus ebraccatus]|uniref:phospholipase A2 inhibitor gamma subunit B-like n=1 Tax=Dendropsophus ebraccatus TaxID=150705 RepID=UPI0038322638